MKHYYIIFTITLGSIVSSFSQEYFDLTEEYPCENCPNYLTDFNLQTTYTSNEIKAIFDLIRDTEIEFDYTQGGCQHRAHIMSIIMSKMEISHFKVWLFAPTNLYENDSRKLSLSDKNNLSKNSTINWGYHVAPAVLVEDNGVKDTLVLDPSLNNKEALKLANWLNVYNFNKGSKYTFLEKQWWSFITNGGNNITGEF